MGAAKTEFRRLVKAALVIALSGIFAAGSLADGQTAAAAPADKSLAFEVATIKPVEPGIQHLVGVKVYPGGRLGITTFSLRSLICTAFGISYWQLSGGPEWAEKDEFDIEAKPPQTTPPTEFNIGFTNFTIADERLRLMLQTLLVDRFQLKFHRETATGPVYLLERTGKPTPLKPTKLAYANDAYGKGYSEVTGGGERWYLYNARMADVAHFADNYIMHRAVMDKTGLDGAFDYRWTMLAATPDSQPPDNQECFKLFLDAIGLKLTPSTGPVETFVIDHAEKPTPN